MGIDIRETTTSDLFLAAFAKPEDFQGDILERLLLQKELELARRIRRVRDASTAKIAKLASLILEESWNTKTNQPQTETPEQCLDRIRQLHAPNSKVPDEALVRRVDILEKLYEILQSEDIPAPTQDVEDVI